MGCESVGIPLDELLQGYRTLRADRQELRRALG